MKKLLDVGIVEREQRGKWAYFTLNAESLRTLAAVADLKGVCC
jgi:DNA-binding transcriptional ArsR family regulator